MPASGLGGEVTAMKASSQGGSNSGATTNFGDSLSHAAGAVLVSLQKALLNDQQFANKNLQLSKLDQQKHKLEQKLGESSIANSDLIPPPTPKNTPFFMTPPLTPPNESYINHDTDPGKPPKAPKVG